MRHRIHQRKLNRTSEHRRALMRNMAQSLIEHGKITTTIPKAKNLRPFVERLVTLAVKTRKLTAASDNAGALRARRSIHKLLTDRGLVPKDHQSTYDAMSDAHRAKTMRMQSGRRYRTGEPKGRLAFTAESVTHRLIESIAPRFEDRPGGYTRLVRLAKKRVGDAAQLAVLQLVGDEEAPTSLTKPGRSARRRRADARYSMAIKRAKSWAGSDQASRRDAEAQKESAESAKAADSGENDSDTGKDVSQQTPEDL